MNKIGKSPARLIPSGDQVLIEAIYRSFGALQRAVPDCCEGIRILSESPVAGRSEQPLVDALAGRELDVLEHLAKRLYDKEIGDELGISVETVKTHVKRIRGKLGVSSRREAAAKARELGLLGDHGGGP